MFLLRSLPGGEAGGGTKFERGEAVGEEIKKSLQSEWHRNKGLETKKRNPGRQQKQTKYAPGGEVTLPAVQITLTSII